MVKSIKRCNEQSRASFKRSNVCYQFLQTATDVPGSIPNRHGDRRHKTLRFVLRRRPVQASPAGDVPDHLLLDVLLRHQLWIPDIHLRDAHTARGRRLLWRKKLLSHCVFGTSGTHDTLGG